MMTFFYLFLFPAISCSSLLIYLQAKAFPVNFSSFPWSSLIVKRQIHTEIFILANMNGSVHQLQSRTTYSIFVVSWKKLVFPFVFLTPNIKKNGEKKEKYNSIYRCHCLQRWWHISTGGQWTQHNSSSAFVFWIGFGLISMRCTKGYFNHNDNVSVIWTTDWKRRKSSSFIFSSLPLFLFFSLQLLLILFLCHFLFRCQQINFFFWLWNTNTNEIRLHRIRRENINGTKKK